MQSIRFRLFAATVGLCLANAATALATPPDPPSRLAINPPQAVQAPEAAAVNQQLANTIVSQLRQSGQLHHYTVNVRVEGTGVELTGQIADQTQREEVLRIVQGVPGVERVRDLLQIVTAPRALASSPFATEGRGVIPATTQAIMQEPRPLMNSQPDAFVPPAPTAITNGMPNATPNEPMPIFRAPPMMGGFGGPGVGMPPPPMPPYAWPTYAPYNNYSRVAYPCCYPLEAFPFIGPMNPYPKVPLGWRSVQLRWQDGHWWFGRLATGHDYWRVRYW